MLKHLLILALLSSTGPALAALDLYVAPEGKLVANGLYVAMTRARSLLAIYGLKDGSEASCKIGSTIESCIETQRTALQVDCDEEG